MLMKLLAGDIGGTNTRLIYAELNTKGRQIISEKSYASSEYSDFNQVLTTFLHEHNITDTIDAACFAVAGPVMSGIVAVTNLPWVISENELEKTFKIAKVNLINDFIAVVYGIAELKDADTVTLQQGEVKSSSVKPDAIVIGAGTGLGVAHRIWLNDHYHALSTEAGHAGFAPENTQQCQLLKWLQKTQSHVSLENILSGKGLVTIYNFLRDQEGITESVAVAETMQKNDSSQVVTEYALSENDELCQKTLEFFIDIYGAAAGNAVLQFYPVDEVYIAGGIAPKIKDKLVGQHFIDAFNNKGLMSDNMQKISIKLILQDNIGLYGALSVVAGTNSDNLDN